MDATEPGRGTAQSRLTSQPGRHGAPLRTEQPAADQQLDCERHARQQKLSGTSEGAERVGLPASRARLPCPLRPPNPGATRPKGQGAHLMSPSPAEAALDQRVRFFSDGGAASPDEMLLIRGPRRGGAPAASWKGLLAPALPPAASCTARVTWGGRLRLQEEERAEKHCGRGYKEALPCSPDCGAGPSASGRFTGAT